MRETVQILIFNETTMPAKQTPQKPNEGRKDEVVLLDPPSDRPELLHDQNLEVFTPKRRVVVESLHVGVEKGRNECAERLSTQEREFSLFEPRDL
ncbi:hypothetical protein AVEN_18706-1 [Araneus ventricosus]|uniref:Uncharacterized protein n=1 Tax=Araneus ventricosus TaxID=182803 RepID=A0A4Y2PGM7_ARAVE|nr:hypothetical protein AVEN_18706-1 [Araneus ventricosus]